MDFKQIVSASLLLIAGATAALAFQPGENSPKGEGPRGERLIRPHAGPGFDIDLDKLFPTGPSRNCPKTLEAAAVKSCGPRPNPLMQNGACQLVRKSCSKDNTSCIKRANLEHACLSEEVTLAGESFNQNFASLPAKFDELIGASEAASRAVDKFGESEGCEAEFLNARAISTKLRGIAQNIHDTYRAMNSDYDFIVQKNGDVELTTNARNSHWAIGSKVVDGRMVLDFEHAPQDLKAIKWSQTLFSERFSAITPLDTLPPIEIGQLPLINSGTLERHWRQSGTAFSRRSQHYAERLTAPAGYRYCRSSYNTGETSFVCKARLMRTSTEVAIDAWIRGPDLPMSNQKGEFGFTMSALWIDAKTTLCQAKALGCVQAEGEYIPDISNVVQCSDTPGGYFRGCSDSAPSCFNGLLICQSNKLSPTSKSCEPGGGYACGVCGDRKFK